jgi:hypothetical protein
MPSNDTHKLPIPPMNNGFFLNFNYELSGLAIVYENLTKFEFGYMSKRKVKKNWNPIIFSNLWSKSNDFRKNLLKYGNFGPFLKNRSQTFFSSSGKNLPRKMFVMNTSSPFGQTLF